MATEIVKCSFLVEKRGRRCRMVAAKGSIYCGEHLVHDKHHQRRRIPCPLDPSHSIFEDQLVKHQKKCNAAKKPRPSCYRHGINAGLDHVLSKEELLPLSKYPIERVQELVARVEIAYQSHLVANTIDNCILRHPSLAVDLSDPNNGPSALKHLTQQSSILGHLEALELLHTKNTTYIEFGSGRGKLSECIQRALQYKLEEERHPCCKRARLSRNHHVVKRGDAINTKSPCTPIEVSLTSDVKETGTSVSGTTNSLLLYPSSDVSTDVNPEEDDAILDTTTTLNNVHFLLVDRSNCRRKVDGSLRTSSLIGVQYHRLLMDIEHLDLTMVDCLQANPDTEHVVAVSKHLCGAATDLTLRCLVSGRFRRGESSLGTTSMSRLSGVLIALCCHHRCTWSQLVGKELFTDMGFSPVDFHMISHMTSWAVCGVRPEKLALRTDHMTSSETVSDKQSIEGQQPKNSDSDRNDLNGVVGDVVGEVESSSVVGAEPHSKCGYIAHSNESIGLKCKRLIDLARIYYLKSHGFKVRLVYYVDKRTSLENVLLIAT